MQIRKFFDAACILLYMRGSSDSCNNRTHFRKIQNKIGDTGITVIGKIMGLILASFAIQNILTGIKDYFKM